MTKEDKTWEKYMAEMELRSDIIVRNLLIEIRTGGVEVNEILQDRFSIPGKAYDWLPAFTKYFIRNIRHRVMDATTFR